METRTTTFGCIMHLTSFMEMYQDIYNPDITATPILQVLFWFVNYTALILCLQYFFQLSKFKPVKDSMQKCLSIMNQGQQYVMASQSKSEFSQADQGNSTRTVSVR